MSTSLTEKTKRVLNHRLFSVLNHCDPNDFQEIRVRLGQPLTVVNQNKSFQLDNSYICVQDDIKEIVLKVCDQSLHSIEETIRQGYISLPDGDRIGVVGNFMQRKNLLDSITGLNIRFANQVFEVSDKLLTILDYSPCNLLIAGPPACGKTTMLRDIARKFSYLGYRVCIADERGEIGGAFDLGTNCDVLSGVDKATAIEQLIRTMNPQILVFDELGNAQEAAGVYRSMNSGVYCISSIHADTKQNLEHRLRLFFGDYCPFQTLVLMNRRFEIEQVMKIDDY